MYGPMYRIYVFIQYMLYVEPSDFKIWNIFEMILYFYQPKNVNIAIRFLVINQ